MPKTGKKNLAVEQRIMGIKPKLCSSVDILSRDIFMLSQKVLLNAKPGIRKAHFGQRRMLHQDCEPLGPNRMLRCEGEIDVYVEYDDLSCLGKQECP